MNASDVTFAVLNFNGRQLLEQLLPTIYAQTADGFGVLVVDNGSSDGSAQWLAAHHPDVQVMSIPQNVGVTRALNAAMDGCATTYVALLNNDIELTPTWLAEMRQALENFPDAASADGKLLNFHRRGELDGAGDLIAVTGECSKRGFGQEDAGQYDTPAQILCASGGAALYRAQAFVDVGPFDETYGAYYEDADWGLRAFLRGHACRYVPSAVAFHMGSATTDRAKADYAYLFSRNNLLLLGKCLPAATMLRLAPLLMAFQLKWLLHSCRAGNGRAHLRGWQQAAGASRELLRRRRQVQSRRVVSDKALRGALTPVDWQLRHRG